MSSSVSEQSECWVRLKLAEGCRHWCPGADPCSAPLLGEGTLPCLHRKWAPGLTCTRPGRGGDGSEEEERVKNVRRRKRACSRQWWLVGQLEAPAWALLYRAAGSGLVGAARTLTVVPAVAAACPGLWKPPSTEGLLGTLTGPGHQLLEPCSVLSTFNAVAAAAAAAPHAGKCAGAEGGLFPTSSMAYTPQGRPCPCNLQKAQALCRNSLLLPGAF